MLKETEKETPERKVRVVSVKFEGAASLPRSLKAQIASQLKQTDFDDDSPWTDMFQEIARETLQEHGYFYAKPSAQARVLSSDPKEERVSLTLHVVEGFQYRLGEIEFANTHVFPASELRNSVPLRDGDVFDVAQIRVGIDAIMRLYGSQGYINMTANPDTRVDNAQQRIYVLLDIAEDKQFRVGSVEVLTSDPKLSAQALNLKLKEGDIFNTNLLEDFYSAIKPFLPADASPRELTQIDQDPRNNTVAIVFDFRGCP